MDLLKLDLNLLKVFDALMKERHVSRAAERLCLSQPAMSHALKRLREQLGDEIVLRGKHGMEPTNYAESIIAPVSQILHMVENQLLNPEPFQPEVTTRKFTLGVDTHLVPSIVPPIAMQLHKLAPNACLKVNLLPPGFLLKPSLEGDTELAIGTTFNNPNKLLHQHLFTEKIVGLVRKGHPKYRKRATLKQLAKDYEFVDYAVKGEDTTLMDDLMAEHQLTRSVPIVVSDLQGIFEYILWTDLMFIGGIKQATATVKRLGLELPYGVIALPKEFTQRYHSRVDMYWRPQQDKDPGLAWFRSIVAETGALIETSA